ncbi:PIG-L deacetylase family protein [Parenemella sanctibonifatiensis]|uniref:GlcNAc-PI de-N-acetylase n=1 Tax=Parenemella sanctibonifatiensis TaxID=2016505 RepID=A0A255EGK9_9ACTN|nr:PIG-L family deacetylase [Parenemella sanctibonifatiensis]OYN90370.1 GlcNAc-PI de-N-acetylase [Parenemella sanctibonifatiensis]
MTTIVFLHAHPDDEASQTSGTMYLAVQQGHRVVCVYGTNGEHGTVPDDLSPGETVIDRRRSEAERSAEVLGTARVAWLGYADSGMTGWEQNSHATSFHSANVEEAAGRLAAILDEEDADVVVGYDWHGGYGHPDHVKVHAVARRAAELARRTPRFLQSTMNRDHVRRLWQAAVDAGVTDAGWNPDNPADDGNPFGTPEAELHWFVDATPVIDIKRAALACHASQEDAAGILQMPEDHFAGAFGGEWFIEEGRPAGIVAGLPS